MQVRAVDWDDADAVALRSAQRVEIAERYGTPDSEPGPAPSVGDVVYFVVAYTADGVAAGCGGLRRIDDRSGEIKRMYVAPAHRGTGVSTAVLDALEAEGRRLGWTHLRLETGDRQPDAVAFYTRHGYRRIPRFGHYADSADSLCFERPIAAPE